MVFSIKLVENQEFRKNKQNYASKELPQRFKKKLNTNGDNTVWFAFFFSISYIHIAQTPENQVQHQRANN